MKLLSCVRLSLLFWMAIAGISASAQDVSDSGVPLSCEIKADGCNVLLTPNFKGDIALEEASKPAGRFAGQTLCIRGGEYHQFWAKSLKGTASKPVKITNCEGKATFTSGAGGSVSFFDSRYVRLTGTGDPSIPYGIVGHSTNGGMALEIGYGSSDFEVDHFEGKGNPLTYSDTGKPILTALFGISFKTYPDCANPKWDRGNFTQYNSLLHDNYLHDIQYEGIYLGTSHNGWITANRYTPGYDKCTPRRIEADLVNVEVVGNRIENIGNDAIQVGGSLERTLIKNNRIYNFGLNADPPHSSAIQVGPGTKATVDSNWIENPTSAKRISQGVKHQGLGGSVFMNNVIIGASNGLQLLRNTDINLGLNLPDTHIYNNTIIDSSAEAIYFFCSYLKSVHLKNNLTAGYMLPYMSGNGGYSCLPGLTTQNLYFDTTQSVGFVNPAAKDYRITPTSLAAATGQDLTGVVDFDFNGQPRNGVYQFGAYKSIAINQTVKVNFTTGIGPYGDSTWNNFGPAHPAPGLVLNNLKDQNGATTPYAIHVIGTFTGSKGAKGDGGKSTGNDSGAVPDAVAVGLWYGQGAAARMELSGLSTGKRYALVFFASRAGSGLKNTIFSAQNQSGMLDAANNTTATVTLTDLLPNPQGKLEFQIRSDSNSGFFYLNAVQIIEK